ncbi:MAG: Ig-like domain-containing protein [Alistipes sp.]|nr:Ig-like domain-containing protein [Alistipes sp.]
MMSIKEIAIYKRIVQCGILMLCCMLFLYRCASVAQPQGGPRDTLPPRIVAMTPAYGTTHFTGKRIYIEFNEYVQIKDQQKEFFTSPFMRKKPSIMLRGRGVQIDLKEDLDSNRTYALNFGKSISDNNEGNPYTGLRYVFSTGDAIDSMLMSGYTVDANKGDTVGNVYLLFYPASLDSIPDYDSTLFKNAASSVARSFPNGIFIAENLKPIDYRIYALQDNNSNMEYEPGVDRVAFLDTVYNPLQMPPFDIWYDTTRRYLQANPQLMFRLFQDTPFRRQNFSGASRPQGNKLVFNFSGAFPDIRELKFDEIDSSQIMVEYMTPRHDTMTLWIHARDTSLSDTLHGRLIYMKHDSLMRLYPDTQKLRLAWRHIVKKEEKKKKNDTLPEPNPFKVRVSGGTSINPEKNIPFEFEYPLWSMDSSAITLEKLPGAAGDANSNANNPPKSDPSKPGEKVRFTFRRDSVNLRKWTLSAPWVAEAQYRLLIPAGTFQNYNEEQNDTLKTEFSIDAPDKYASLTLNLEGKSPESEYIVQIVKPDGSLLKEVPHLRTGTHTLQYIEVGTIKIRIIEDLNRNGRWDTGSLTARRQPERVEFFADDANNEVIETKANWEVVYDLKMDQLFGPVTMERMNAKIARDNEIRLKELAKKRAEKAKKDKQGHGSSNSGMGVSSGIGGMSNISNTVGGR